MASIVLLLSELLGGESASVLAADRYIMGGQRLGLGEFRPAVASAAATREDGRLAEQAPEGMKQSKEESFEDLEVSRIAVDVMWP
ncbi:hypothetical protein HU200_021173 [Digitaria exilis]|uniref:Uncharacterized protein n=1 Tax=Digitaria exilis TaxID=1010633 RepID=A0A835EZY0_9POAL|nr:hypothetical protein HU200_021173 [Digitaria exilis]